MLVGWKLFDVGDVCVGEIARQLNSKCCSWWDESDVTKISLRFAVAAYLAVTLIFVKVFHISQNSDKFLRKIEGAAS